MTKHLLASAAALSISIVAASGSAAAQDVVRLDGSSTVYPISEAFAEEFQKETGNRVTVGLSGTGGGFKKFCRGETDISGASRPIKPSEIEACKQAGIDFVELPVALDAIAVIVNPGSAIQCVTIEQLKKIWEPAAQGQVTRWNQADASWPDEELKLFGPGTDSGTYDYFTLAINGEEGKSRGDYTATEDDNITIQGVSGSAGGLGYLGLAYAEENEGRVKAVGISQDGGECVMPTKETARDGTYQPLSRPLFYYVSTKSLERPEVKAFMEFGLKADTSEALVDEVGYVPLPAEVYELAGKKLEAKKTGSVFEHGSQVGIGIADLVKLEQ